MGVRVVVVVEGRIELPYRCEHCHARATARVRVAGQADLGDGARAEAEENALALGALALRCARCPSCDHRGADWAREWLKAAALWVSSAVLGVAAYLLRDGLSMSSDAPLTQAQSAGFLAGLFAVGLAVAGAAYSILAYELPHRVQWLDVAAPKSKRKRSRAS